MTVQANIKAVQDAYDAVKDHCMCRAIHDNGVIIRVLLPAGYYLDGVQCSYGVTNTKSEALRRLLAQMEIVWQESVPK